MCHTENGFIVAFNKCKISCARWIYCYGSRVIGFTQKNMCVCVDLNITSEHISCAQITQRYSWFNDIFLEFSIYILFGVFVLQKLSNCEWGEEKLHKDVMHYAICIYTDGRQKMVRPFWDCVPIKPDEIYMYYFALVIFIYSRTSALEMIA